MSTSKKIRESWPDGLSIYNEEDGLLRSSDPEVINLMREAQELVARKLKECLVVLKCGPRGKKVHQVQYIFQKTIYDECGYVAEVSEFRADYRGFLERWVRLGYRHWELALLVSHEISEIIKKGGNNG
jgi:hypothetical protein